MTINIISTGSYAGEKILDNEYFAKIVDTNDEWIQERTGIRTRHICDDITTEEMATRACESALDKLDMDRSKIGLVIFASVSSDTKTPASSFNMAGRLGLNGNPICFDLNAACSGFVYSMAVARSIMASMKIAYAIVIGAERLSKFVDWSDRSTCILFGDGAGCAVLENSDLADDSVSSSLDYRLEIEDTYLAGRYDKKKYLTLDSRDSLKEMRHPFIGMNGRQIYKFATDVGVKVIDRLLESNCISKDDIEFLVPHQANKRIIETLALKSQIPDDRWFVNLDEYGNTSAASIPLALNELVEKVLPDRKLEQIDGRRIISLAFGGGLSYGGFLLKIRKK